MTANGSKNLLENIDWPALDRRVSRQQRNREVHSPAISLYRWWARRSHALIGEILSTADEGSLISDPFSGGGTVALEAATRNLDIYAQDLHPWATSGLATALDRVDPSELERAGQRWLDLLGGERSRLYGTGNAEDGDEILTTFWVRICNCPRCDQEVYLYPYSLLTLASRAKAEPYGFYGCNACGAVSRCGRATEEKRCSGCRRRLRRERDSCLPQGQVRCPNGKCGESFPAFAPGARWAPVLVQRREDGEATIGRPRPNELVAAQVDQPELPAALCAEIPSGLETARLRRAGFRCWADLYPPRQLHALLGAAAALKRLELSGQIEARLRLLLCGAGEMAGYGSRWDRFYPKAFEAMSNHRFALTGFAAEVNLLADRGRGTLARRLEHSVRAARWGARLKCAAPSVRTSGAGRLHEADLDRPVVVCGSSSTQLLRDDSVDLVLTDPPYYDDVQYAELGSLFLSWAQATGLMAASVHVDLRSEAVPNSVRGTDVSDYARLLSAVLAESARTLKPDGRVVLTFHNSDGRAWWALARALGRAGLYVTALAVAHAENETDHAKRGRRAFSRDLVVECRAYPPSGGIVIATEARDSEARQLLAAGRAVADLCAELAGGEIKRTRSYVTFGSNYRKHLGDRPSTYIRFGADRKEKSG